MAVHLDQHRQHLGQSADMNAVIQGLIIIIIGIGGCLSYFYLSNQLLEKVLFPPRGENAGRNINRANMIRPWLFSFPVIFMMGVYIVYPVFETLRLSLTDRDAGDAFVGLANYQQLFNDTKFWEAMRNNLLWLIVVPATCTAFGLLIAELTDRIAWGNIAKSIFFMPMAISFVGASVVFMLLYDIRPVAGVLNAVWMQFEGGVRLVSFSADIPSDHPVGLRCGGGVCLLPVPAPLLHSGGTKGENTAIFIFGADPASRNHQRGSASGCRCGCGLSCCPGASERDRRVHDHPALRQTPGLEDDTVLEQFLPDGRDDLVPDRLSHGVPVGGAARHSAGNG